MPQPIRKVTDQTDNSVLQNKESQDLGSILPILNQPYSLLQQFVYSSGDKDRIKEIWLSSDSKDDKTMIVSASIDDKELSALKNKGLIEVLDKEGKHISLTRQGEKLLNESVLNTESSFSKTASKKMVLKNSYDFGDEILVRVNHPEKFGSRYVLMEKSKMPKKAEVQQVEDYSISTRDKEGELKGIDEYSDEELIHILHLSKKLVNMKSKTVVASNQIKTVPTNRIKAFAETIFNELNSR